MLRLNDIIVVIVDIIVVTVDIIVDIDLSWW